MNADTDRPYDGRCTCGDVRYRLTSAPLFVHCCHCTWCQRESGASFALNAMIETDRVVLLQGSPEFVDTPSASGKGQKIARCPRCRVALWSHYAGAGDAVAFVRVGTLEEPGRRQAFARDSSPSAPSVSRSERYLRSTRLKFDRSIPALRAAAEMLFSQAFMSVST